MRPKHPLRADEMAALRAFLGRKIRERRADFQLARVSSDKDPLGVMAHEAAQESDLFLWCALQPRKINTIAPQNRWKIRHGWFAYIGLDIFSGDT